MIPRSFYFLRHGETDENVKKVLQGQIDVPINANGRLQAEQAVSVLKNHPIDRIITSPLIRAAETAAIVNAVLAKPLHEDRRIMERSFGLHEGKNNQEIRQWEKENLTEEPLVEPETGFPCPPGGEIYSVFRDRVIGGFASLLNQYPHDNILFVAHGRVFGALHLALFGHDTYSHNAHPYRFDKTTDGWVLTCLMEETQS